MIKIEIVQDLITRLYKKRQNKLFNTAKLRIKEIFQNNRNKKHDLLNLKINNIVLININNNNTIIKPSNVMEILI